MGSKKKTKKPRIYEQAYEGEWFPVRPRNQVIECCDCCLVHKHSFRVRDGYLEMKVTRDNRSTAQRRRAAGIKLTKKREPKRKQKD